MKKAKVSVMSQVTWQFYAGIDTIGGNIIAVTCDNHRLIFDMGRIFNPGAPIFDQLIPDRGIEDLKKVGIVPSIEGIFEDGTAAPSGMKTMVAVSHSHLDHTGLFPYLRTDISVLMSTNTHRLIQALDLVADGPRKPLRYVPLEPGEWMEFGPFKIQLIPVEHDTIGSSAMFIETPEGRMVYSGDLRLHGRQPEVTRGFMQAAHAFRPDILWIEGTRVFPETHPGRSELEMQGQLIETICNQKDGVYFTYYNRNPERLHSFVKAAAKSGRTLVLEASSAFIFSQFDGDIRNIAVYGGTSADKWSEYIKAWIHENKLKIVTPADVRDHESQYIVELQYPNFIDWLDIGPQQGGIYIHSNGAPIGPFDPLWNNMLKWVSMLELEFSNLGCTGHASRQDILSIVDAIQPDVLMPIHSLYPKRIGLPTIKRLMPEYNKIYTFAETKRLAVRPSAEDIEEVM